MKKEIIKKLDNLSNFKIETHIQKYYNEHHENEYVSIHSPLAAEEAKKYLEYTYHEDLPGLLTITFDNEVVLEEHTEDLFITWHTLVYAAVTKIKESPQSIILLDNAIDINLERQGDYAQFIIESNTFTYGYEIRKSPSIPIQILILIEAIISGAKELIKFCEDANLIINEDSSYYAIIEKLENAEKE